MKMDLPRDLTLGLIINVPARVTVQDEEARRSGTLPTTPQALPFTAPRAKVSMSPLRFLLILVSITGLATAGCSGGDDDFPRERISGTVTLDGKPLETGRITFMPTETTGPSTASEAAIKNGAYEISVDQGLAPGPYRVTISSPVPMDAPPKPAAAKPGFDTVSGAGAPDAVEEVLLREAVPAKYNAQTTLKADVTKGGKNEFPFDLKSE
jgi:hypothetical protein